ncbi:MAG: glycosyltransferase, exosortase A system-associated [Alphaproteobacteria bacterium]|nr:glycosyltransferase, exosortase A system-associated [Alphaproteobacteria bacterium]
MRVLHVFDHSVPHQSGYAVRSLAIMAAQERMGWTVAAVTSPRHGSADAAEETINDRVFARTPATLHAAPIVRELTEMQATRTRIRAVATDFLPDIIHAHSPLLTAFPARSIANALRTPMTYEIRAFWEDAAVDHGTTAEGSLRYRATRALETRASRQADHVFTICQGLRRDLMARGIAEGRVSTVPNAVDLAQLKPSDPESNQVQALRQRLGLGDAAVIGFIGSFYAYEGLDLALEATERMAAAGRDVRFLIVGAGPEEKSLKERAAPIGDRVIFAGRAAHTDVPDYYALMDILVLPRKSMRLTELVTPLKPLEAMALGVVVLASDVGGHKELIQDGETGFLFEAGNVASMVSKVEDILGRRRQMAGVKIAARKFVKRERTWDASVANYIEPFQRLVEAARARS